MTKNVAASVKARLLGRAKEQGEEFERFLVRYAAERLLYRLGESAVRDRALLKGASLLAVWLPDPYRATRDIDLLAFGASDESGVRALVREVCAVPCPEDGLRFDLSRITIETIRAEEEHVGKRVRFPALLGTARITLQIDIGTGDAVDADREEIEYPILLEGLPAPRLQAYPRAATVAEKLEAMVKLDTRNSRMKDFHDLWALSLHFAFEGAELGKAVADCFERRGTRLLAGMPRPLTPSSEDGSEIPMLMGVYVAVRMHPGPARFLAENPGGHFKGRDPTLAVAQLRSRWIPRCSIVYVGRAGGSGAAATLRSRVREFIAFGRGERVGHWGGRLVWQLVDAWDLLVGWRVLTEDDPRMVEKQLLSDLRAEHGRLPYANLVR